jgi:hypothetical protein
MLIIFGRDILLNSGGEGDVVCFAEGQGKDIAGLILATVKPRSGI